MLDIEDLARSRAEVTHTPYMAWLDAFSEGKSLKEQALINENAFIALAGSCQQPRQFSLLMEAFHESAKEHPEEGSGFDLITRYADESNYGLAEWVEALEYVYDWLGQAKRVSPGLKPLLQYIGCCQEAATSAPAGYPLAGMVEEMLDRYGMDTE